MIRDVLIYISAYIGLFAVTFYALGIIFAKKQKPFTFDEKNAPMVSIIIPAWNEEKGIAGTIESAINLNYPKGKLEIIVIDDGSKDNTFNIASKFKGIKNGKLIRIFKNEKNMGKGLTMNFGIKKAKGEIIVTMDADNIVVKGDILKIMVTSFNEPDIMCVAPTTIIYKPHGILQRIQQVEYLLGVFLRKAFSDMNAIHITSGAFSVYRKEFFDKYGGFSSEAITEDMEMALRIQSNNFRIVNNLNAIAYTVAPNEFVPLMKQRRRWYTGLLRCLLHYKKLFSKKYGAMGVIVLPVALITVFLSVIMTSYLVVNSFIKLKKELVLWNSINFNVLDNLQFSKFVFERYLFLLFSKPVTIFAILFILILVGYMIFAKKYVKEYSRIKLSLPFFILFYSFLFTFWWLVSFFYTLFNKKVAWR